MKVLLYRRVPQDGFWEPMMVKCVKGSAGKVHFLLEICSILSMWEKIRKNVAWSGLRPHGMVKSCPEYKIWKENYIFWTQEGPTERILETDTAQAGQPDLDRAFVFRRGKRGLSGLAAKQLKIKKKESREERKQLQERLGSIRERLWRLYAWNIIARYYLVSTREGPANNFVPKERPTGYFLGPDEGEMRQGVLG